MKFNRELDEVFPHQPHFALTRFIPLTVLPVRLLFITAMEDAHDEIKRFPLMCVRLDLHGHRQRCIIHPDHHPAVFH